MSKSSRVNKTLKDSLVLNTLLVMIHNTFLRIKSVTSVILLPALYGKEFETRWKQDEIYEQSIMRPGKEVDALL